MKGRQPTQPPGITSATRSRFQRRSAYGASAPLTRRAQLRGSFGDRARFRVRRLLATGEQAPTGSASCVRSPKQQRARGRPAGRSDRLRRLGPSPESVLDVALLHRLLPLRPPFNMAPSLQFPATAQLPAARADDRPRAGRGQNAVEATHNDASQVANRQCLRALTRALQAA